MRCALRERNMKFSLTNKKLNQIKADSEVILAVKQNLRHKWIKDKKDLAVLNFKGAPEEIAFLPHRKRIYIGVESLEHDNLRVACAQAARILKKTKSKSIKIGSFFFILFLLAP